MLKLVSEMYGKFEIEKIEVLEVLEVLKFLIVGKSPLPSSSRLDLRGFLVSGLHSSREEGVRGRGKAKERGFIFLNSGW